MEKREFKFEDFTINFNSMKAVTLMMLYDTVHEAILASKDKMFGMDRRQKEIKAMKALQYIFQEEGRS